MGLSAQLRIGVFYDGNFLLHASNYYNYIHHKRNRLSISRLHDFVKHHAADCEGIDKKDCYIAESHYFRGRLNAVEASQRGNQLYNDRVFEDILMSEGVQTHYLPIRNISGRKEERGIDVWLSLEVLESALLGKIDMAVLIISDTDYVPLLRKLLSLGIKVMLLGWEFDYLNDEGTKVVTKTSHELLQLASYPVMMHDVIENGLLRRDQLIMNLFTGCEPARTDAEIMKPEIVGDMDDNTDPDSFETSEIMSLKSGFGFIRYPNNNLFFHYLDVVGDFSELAIGDSVKFTIGKNQMNQDVAKNVEKL